jgi:hypothetical protein
MIIKPVFKLRRGSHSRFPIEALTLIPPNVRKFCCFIGVEYGNRQELNCASGVLTSLGILTASHVVDVDDIDLIYASFARSKFDYFSLELSKEPLIFKDLDLAIFELPFMSKEFYEPAETIVDNPGLVKEILFKEQIYGFGCPEGILGITWKVEPLAFNRGKVYSKGFAFYGISGGGMFYFKEGKPIVIGIHIAFFPHSGTLITQTFQFNLRGNKK